MPKSSSPSGSRDSATGPAQGTLKRNQACHQCRKRKLKCDAKRPCSTCVRSHNHAVAHAGPDVVLPPFPDCTFDEVKDPGFSSNDTPKSKYEKLENRINELESLLRQKDGESAISSSPPLRTPSGKPMSDGHDIPLPTDEFGLSADMISGSLGAASLFSENAMFASSTEAPLPLHPIGLGLSDTPSMAAYITTGSPGSDTNNSQLIWKQSANLPNPDLLKHLVDVFFASHPHANRLLHRPTFLFTLSLPQTHPKYPRAALLHAICAVASAYTPAVSNPSLQGTRDEIFSSKRRGPSTFAEDQAKFAAEQIDLLTNLGESLLESLQALIVLSWFYWMHARWVEVFIATGRALRSCVPLGISICPPFHSIQHLSRFPSILPLANSALEDELRRNAFYFCYLLDRQQGFANGWAMALDDMDIAQLLPLRGDQFEQGMLVLEQDRQWFHDPHILFAHPDGQTDSFILMVKASIILSKVKNFNLRYKARYFAKDLDYTPTVKAPTQLPSEETMDPRSCPAFIEIDDLVSRFRASFPSDLRHPINGNLVDVNLFTACTIPHMAMIVLHEPHAALQAAGCISATNLLIAARQILTLIYSIWSTSFDLALLDVFISFSWYTCGRIFAKFIQAAYEANRPDQVETLKTELQSVLFALGKMGERIPIAYRYYTMLSAVASQVIRETSQIIPEEPILNDVLFYSSTVPIQHNGGTR
ncbi:hypothetical protein BJ322DRAFT_718166 [Thelephora terrestris]|uniref:Zn(2)-C6 fungal-type domain-containing protein n=1 Tax=Thelephora terrestris TaxID=56493 RepID=A0A9P6HI52_9AGAM|nr:hypothetical protein BJ322DRAFT_718166 [Thelephora terrestris]